MADPASIKNDLLSAFRDFEVDGVPASGPSKPNKSAIRFAVGSLADRVEDVASLATGKWISFSTKAAMDAVLSYPADAEARVYNDGVNNGVYKKTGASGSGSWTYIGPIPESDTTEIEDTLATVVSEVDALTEDVAAALSKADGAVVGVEYEQVPLAVSDRGSHLWLENGRVALAPIAESLVDQIRHALSFASDGRTLHKLRARIVRQVFGAVGEPIKILLIGDSWVQGDAIARGILRSISGFSGQTHSTGFVSVLGTASAPALDAATFTRTGTWTLTDASANTSYPNGIGPDGHSIATVSAAATATLADVRATDIIIWYWNAGSGTFRYRVDAGAWVTITTASSGSLASIALTGLSDTLHTVEIDTTGNTGTVSLCGFYCDRQAGTTGVQISRFGNGGMTATLQALYQSNMAVPLAAIDPDLIITILGTNDYQGLSSPPRAYYDTLLALDSIIRDAVPDAGIVHIVPPQSNGTEVIPLSEYADVAKEVAADAGTEYLILLDTWGAYAQGAAFGLWADTLHPGGIGGAVIGRQINETFIKLGSF